MSVILNSQFATAEDTAAALGVSESRFKRLMRLAGPKAIARRVLAAGYKAWRSVETFGWGTGKAGFELARRALGSQVEDLEIDVYDVSRKP